MVAQWLHTLGGGLSLGQSGTTGFFRSLETGKIAKGTAPGWSIFVPREVTGMRGARGDHAGVSPLNRDMGGYLLFHRT
jgi:hypothetical protein